MAEKQQHRVFGSRQFNLNHTKKNKLTFNPKKQCLLQVSLTAALTQKESGLNNDF